MFAFKLPFLLHFTVGHFIFLISLSLRPKTETKRLNFGLSPEFSLINQSPRRTSLLIAHVINDIPVFFCIFMNKRKSEVIFVDQNLISNRLTYLVRAKKQPVS